MSAGKPSRTSGGHHQVLARPLVRPGVQIHRRGGKACVPQGRLEDVQGDAALDAMTGMAVPHDVWGHGLSESLQASHLDEPSGVAQ